jgi:RNA polymerase sigma-70 factor (ECF subfamily)
MRAAERVALVDGPLRNSVEGHPQSTADDPSERLEREERCRQVRQAISQLADEHRVVLVLREMDGCCYETIAEILDLPVGTVRSRLHRARMQLREHLKEVLAVEG